MYNFQSIRRALRISVSLPILSYDLVCFSLFAVRWITAAMGRVELQRIVSYRIALPAAEAFLSIVLSM